MKGGGGPATQSTKVVFCFRKILMKEKKNSKENDFFMFSYLRKKNLRCV